MRNAGGVVAILAGTVLLIGGLRGTWKRVWADLFSGGSAGSGVPGSGVPGFPSPSQGGPVRTPGGGLATPPSDNGGYCTDPRTGYKIICPPGITPGNEVGPPMRPTSYTPMGAGFPGSLQTTV